MKFSITLSARSALVPMLGMAVVSCIDPRPPGYDYLADVGGPGRHQATGGPHHPPPAIPDDVSYWDGDGVSGAPLIRINRSQQKASFYKGGVLVGVSRISSGNEDHGTPKGNYRIIEKDQDHQSTIYGVFKDQVTGQTINDNVDIRVDKIPPGAVFYNAPMPNFMRFASGIGMHTGYLPGYAASHGCVRMPHQMAEKFFENVKVGTPVIVE
ncbi:MAG: L,D-transpeptidase family protein [Verrucomicrobia bacterium]|nr:L,D-transpeptidase family protein [Verrucomicrobiota bacterium]